jgi:hypothetical protein
MLDPIFTHRVILDNRSGLGPSAAVPRVRELVHVFKLQVVLKVQVVSVSQLVIEMIYKFAVVVCSLQVLRFSNLLDPDLFFGNQLRGQPFVPQFFSD